MSAFARVSFATASATSAIHSRKISCAADARAVDLADTAFSVRGDRNRLRLVKPEHQKVSSGNSFFFFFVFLSPSVPENIVRADLGRSRTMDDGTAKEITRSKLLGIFSPKSVARFKTTEKRNARSIGRLTASPCSAVVVFTVINLRDKYDYNGCSHNFEKDEKRILFICVSRSLGFFKKKSSAFQLAVIKCLFMFDGPGRPCTDVYDAHLVWKHVRHRAQIR